MSLFDTHLGFRLDILFLTNHKHIADLAGEFKYLMVRTRTLRGSNGHDCDRRSSARLKKSVDTPFLPPQLDFVAADRLYEQLNDELEGRKEYTDKEILASLPNLKYLEKSTKHLLIALHRQVKQSIRCQAFTLPFTNEEIKTIEVCAY